MSSDELFFKNAIDAHYKDDKSKSSVKHNFGIFSLINGAYALTEETFHKFHPWYDYWWVPERLFLVSFFSKFWHQRFYPAESLRNIVYKTFLHFERARQDGILNKTYKSVSEFTEPNWSRLAKQFSEIIENMAEPSEFEDLQAIKFRNLPGESHKESLIGYLKQINADENLSDLWKTSYQQRLPFFPYIGLTEIDDLEKRQTFFMAYNTLFTSTNSYKIGGAQTFAPILQNNSTETLLNFIKRWTEGGRPDEMEMEVYTKGIDKVNCNLYMPVIELYGFLNLKSEPFFNKAAKGYWEEFGGELSQEKSDILKLTKRIGKSARDFLAKNPGVINNLSDQYNMLAQEKVTTMFNIIQMEGVRSSKKYIDENLESVDDKLQSELRNKLKSMELTDKEKAGVVLNLMLDSFVYNASKKPPIIVDTPPSIEENDDMEPLSLPESLRRIGNDALGYLKAGYHVLFAGAPGTGKTTLAQFVGYAWDKQRSELQSEIPITSIPFTTVANSAWAPFHTIGGVLPDGKGNFSARKGIFIDSEDKGEGMWRLRSCAIILDEMNRADLDRCIGELYPILSSSVQKVAPAGIPGVEYIYNSDKFRLIATVNDSNLDDIVFPISEGLSRRFQRIDLYGGTKDLIREFIAEDIPESRKEYMKTAIEVIDHLFSACEENELTYTSEEGVHIPFGVGYFNLMKSWIRNDLKMSETFNEISLTDQARQILKSSIWSIIKNRGLSSKFQNLFDDLSLTI
jgi:AAA domain (dynein-related subfamily)